MDLRAQGVSIWIRRWWVIGGAVTVGLLVLLVSSFLPREYAASTTVRVVQTGGTESAVQSETVAYYGQTVAGLGETVETLDAVIARSGMPLTRDEVAAQTEVLPSSIPGFLTVTARASTPEGSARLADATVAALAARVAQDNEVAVQNGTEPIRQQIRAISAALATLPPGAPDRVALEQQLTGLGDAVTRIQAGSAPQLLVGAPAVVPPIPESPTPRRNAALGLLAALVLLAEGLVVVRALQGRLTERDPADEVTRLTGLPAVQVRSRESTPALLAPLLHDHFVDEGRIVVVQVGKPTDLDVGRRLQTSAALVAAGASPDAHATVPRVQTIRGRTVDQAVLETVRLAEGPVVLAVDTARAGRRSLEEGVAALTAVGASVVGVVVWRGHFPRERATPASSYGGVGSSSQSGPGQPGPGQSGPGQPGPGQGPGQPGPGQNGPGQNGGGQNGPGRPGPGNPRAVATPGGPRWSG